MNQLESENEVIIERSFEAPRELVFKLWTDPFHLAHWWTPFGFAAHVMKMEVRAGGSFHIELQTPDGQRIPARGTYLKISAPEMIVLRGPDKAEDACGAGIPPNAVVTITFEESGNKTKLSLHTQFNVSIEKQAASEAGYYQGWESALIALERYLSTVKEE